MVPKARRNSFQTHRARAHGIGRRGEGVFETLKRASGEATLLTASTCFSQPFRVLLQPVRMFDRTAAYASPWPRKAKS